MKEPTTDDLDSQQWGQRLRALRLENDWSQADVAEKLGVDAVYCFGSLTDDHGERFTATSDIDVAVEGLPARERFEAEVELELDSDEEECLVD